MKPGLSDSDIEDAGRKESESRLSNRIWSRYLEVEEIHVLRRYDECMEIIEAKYNSTATDSGELNRAFEQAQDHLEALDNIPQLDGASNDSVNDSVLSAVMEPAKNISKLYNMANVNIEDHHIEVEPAVVDWDEDRKKAMKVLGIGNAGDYPSASPKTTRAKKRVSMLESAFKSMTRGVKKLVHSTSEQ